MAEQAHVPSPDDDPRQCPACGARVAALASTCLMCGVTLDEEEEEPEQEPVRKGLPAWVRSLIVVFLGVVIVLGGGLVLYVLVTAEPEQPALLTPTATDTLVPTRTSTSTPTSTPTQTQAPTATPKPVPTIAHSVKPGETLLEIAERYDVSADAIIELNPDVDPDLVVEGEVLLVPAKTPTPAPTNTFAPGMPTPTPPDYVIHVVAPGQTLSEIGEEYGVSLSAIRSANDLPVDEETIQVNQSLVIPLTALQPTSTATPDPNVTPTPVPPYPAPALLSPRDQAVFLGEEEDIVLQWASVSVLEEDEWYELRLFQPGEGIISSTVHTRVTAWRVPSDLVLGIEPIVQDFRWMVRVVKESLDASEKTLYERAGDSSEYRTFTWLVPTPTPEPASTPGP